MKKQAVLVLISIVVLLLGTFVDYSDLVNLAPWFYAATVALLVAVFFVGKTVDGATRWIPLPFFDLQPSEVAKVVMILFSARIISRSEAPPETLWDVISYYAWTLVPLLLILKQPDLGTALAAAATTTGVLYFSGTSGKIVFKFGALCAAVVATMVLLHIYAGLPLPLDEYQVDRLVSLFQANEDPLGRGYQVIQSKIAIGSGTIWGKGLGRGTQNRLGFIPKQYTDFVFSVVGEELGFVGSMVVLGVYALILFRCLLAALGAPDREGTMVAGGVLAMFAFHLMVNLGMTMGIMPVTGVTLPFLSYGGSSLMVNSFAVGLVLNVGWKRHKILF
jgi:rod shape determining protein RodA